MILFDHFTTDPAFNLALEEYFLLHRRPLGDVFMLWQNEPTVVIGRYQNAFDEINSEYVEAAGVHLVRRNSGGGAVYHDLGNLNYSFLIDDGASEFHFERFTVPVIRTLQQLGIQAENSGRNDIIIAGRKISGNAQYRRDGRLLHHGTILFDANLENLAKALNYAPEKYVTRAVASIRSRVTNVCEHLPRNMTMAEFRRLLAQNVIADYGLRHGALRDDERNEVCKLSDEKYRNREWNYGQSPPSWTHVAAQKFPWGTVDLRLEVRDGAILACALYGDFFSSGEPRTLASHFVGQLFDRQTLDNTLQESEIARVFPDMTKHQLLAMIFPAPTE